MMAALALPWTDFGEFMGWVFVVTLFVAFGYLVVAWTKGSVRAS